jgi:DNA-binding transcriptional ArsR family regulator
VVGDELLVAAEHPAEVAHAGLFAAAQCYCDSEARLRQLKAAGLARSRRDGKMVMYELTARARLLLDAVLTDTVMET